MDKNLYHAVRLNGDEKTICLLSDMWTEEHIFSALDKRVKTFSGAHRLFSRIEQGIVRVYGIFLGTSVKGVVFGCEEKFSPGRFEAHIAFLRGADAAKGCLECEKILVHDYQKDGIRIQQIAGYIPSWNRAAIRMAKRCGYVDAGIDKTKTVIRDEFVFPCHVLLKEMR